MIYDLDGHEYVDYVMSWGALILGHAHPAVTRTIAATAMRGTSFGTPTELESELAELVISMVPSIARIRFVSSGTEATISAVRLARGFTAAPENREVRRVLSRSRRLVFDRRRIRSADARHARFARRYRRNGARHRRVAVQRRRRGRARIRRESRSDRLRDRRAVSRQHGPGTAPRGIPAAPAGSLHAARRAADFRRSNYRFPRRPRRSSRARRHPTGSHDARQDRRRRLARRRVRRPSRRHGIPRRRRVPFTRPARSPAIRSPWRQG